MSAYLCEDEHIKQLAAWLVSRNQGNSDRDWLARRVGYNMPRITLPDVAGHIATLMLRENEKSLAARYGQDISERRISVTLGEILAIQSHAKGSEGRIAHATRCYMYQACEHEGWQGSDAQWCCNQILREAAECLPGYGNSWGIPFPGAFDGAPEVISISDMMA